MIVTPAMKSSWCQTHTGKKFYFFNARPDDFNVEDIAASLSKQCRFNGHIRRFYSVAAHSIHVSRIVSPEAAFWGLMHDACEAYVSDVVKPLKENFPLFNELEEYLQALLIERFKIPYNDAIASEVHAADRYMVFLEAETLMQHPEIIKDWHWARSNFTPRVKIKVKPSWVWLDHLRFRQEFYRLAAINKEMAA